MFKEHAMRKATLIRLFARSNFDSMPDAMMPSFGVYNEEALKRLDVALAAAAENGIRLILVLSNFWPFLGGELDMAMRMGTCCLIAALHALDRHCICRSRTGTAKDAICHQITYAAALPAGAQQWVDKALGPGKDLSLFYTDPTLRQHYKDWVKYVVTRKNTVTGQNYKDDPTIFAW